MPVDPQIAALLSAMAEVGAPPIYEGTAPAGRAQFRALHVDARDPAQVVPVAEVTDRTIPGAAGPRPARVYRPEGPGPHPTVVFLHGGGWVIGDLDTHDNQVRALCRDCRAVVVAVDYRLAPEHPFPAAAQDAVAAARWAAGHLDELGGGPGFGLAGDSAGGNLAAVAAQQLTADGIAVTAQLLIYPAVDAAGDYPSRVENGRGYLLEQVSMAWFYGHYAAGANLKDPQLSPLHAADLRGLPPAVVSIAEFDPLRDEGAAYGAALREAGVDVEVHLHPGMIHGFHGMAAESPAARAAVAEDLARFTELLHR